MDALVKNSTESAIDESFELASTWFNSNSVLRRVGVSNEERLDASDSTSVVSHSITFAHYFAKEDSNIASSWIHDEATTCVSKEANIIISKEGVPSVSEEATINYPKE